MILEDFTTVELLQELSLRVKDWEDLCRGLGADWRPWVRRRERAVECRALPESLLRGIQAWGAQPFVDEERLEEWKKWVASGAPGR